MQFVAQSPGRSGAVSRFHVQAPGLVSLYLFLIVLSERPAWTMFGLMLTPLRLYLLLMIVPALLILLKNRTVRLQSFDYLAVASVFWLLLATCVHDGIERALTFGGSLALEAVGGYLIARTYIRTPEHVFATTRFFVFLVVLTIPLAAAESVFNIELFSGLPYLRDAVAAPPDAIVRLGLHRASVTFDHPILYGVFCASSLGLAWYVYATSPLRMLVVAAVVAATFLSLSSAPLLSCCLTFAFIAWERITRGWRGRVAVPVLLAIAAFGIIELASNRTPFQVVLQFVTLDPWTAYYRLLIWEYAAHNISENPIFGLGLNPWKRPDWMTTSMDSFWLVYGILGGLPAMTLIGTAVILLLRKANMRLGAPESNIRIRARLGWTVAVLVLVFQAFTVHYWGAMHSFFFFVLGLGAWLTDSKSGIAIPGSLAVMRPTETARRSRL